MQRCVSKHRQYDSRVLYAKRDGFNSNCDGVISSLHGRQSAPSTLPMMTSDGESNHCPALSPLYADTPVIACCIAVRAAARVCPSARSGRPDPYGGCGAYSMISSMTRPMLSPAQCPATVMPKSIPAVMPPPVSRLRSTQTRSVAGLSAELVQGFPSTPMHRSTIAS